MVPRPRSMPARGPQELAGTKRVSTTPCAASTAKSCTAASRHSSVASFASACKGTRWRAPELCAVWRRSAAPVRKHSSALAPGSAEAAGPSAGVSAPARSPVSKLAIEELALGAASARERWRALARAPADAPAKMRLRSAGASCARSVRNSAQRAHWQSGRRRKSASEFLSSAANSSCWLWKMRTTRCVKMSSKIVLWVIFV
nr:MAG: hypothetical protein [Molluscum contagiosum virus]